MKPLRPIGIIIAIASFRDETAWSENEGDVGENRRWQEEPPARSSGLPLAKSPVSEASQIERVALVLDLEEKPINLRCLGRVAKRKQQQRQRVHLTDIGKSAHLAESRFLEPTLERAHIRPAGNLVERLLRQASSSSDCAKGS